MLNKAQLEHGMYYKGHCRNASYARWDATRQVFHYRRTKMGQTFIETINHPEDEDKWDVFTPEVCLTIGEGLVHIPMEGG